MAKETEEKLVAEEAETKAETPAPEKTEESSKGAEHKSVQPAEGKSFSARLRRYKTYYLAKKKLAIPLTIVALLLVLIALPFTRYKVLGLVIKSNYYVTVVDDVTFKTVSEATITLDGQVLKTDNSGQVKFRAKVGDRVLSAKKQYYKDFSGVVKVPLRQGSQAYLLKMTSTGRRVPVVVTNKISGKPVENVLVKTSDTEAKTDAEGKVTIVLPADKTTLEATLDANGYNQAKISIKVTEEADKANEFTVTPAGKIYFLSRLSGKLDVVKTNLDGTERQTVLAGTGKEDQSDTSLLASRDWKYLALKSKRDGGDNAKLFLIETANDKLTNMDEGNAVFTPVGWSGDRFIYTLDRQTVQYWQPKKLALKAYNAPSKQITLLDENAAEGSSSNDYLKQNFGNVYILDKTIVYSKGWDATSQQSFNIHNKTALIVSVGNDGSNKKTLKTLTPDASQAFSLFVESRLYTPEEIYFRFSGDHFYEYWNGEVKDASLSEADFYDDYNTYLISPSGSSTFWYEIRDGKNTLFIGNNKGESAKEVAKLSEYVAYGWFSDEYLLVSKNSSELYIMPAAEKVISSQILKISDYHKPSYNFYGYGYGYGGF